jgi:hypothetical protein
MLNLTTPLALGGKRYNVMVAGVRGQWDLQSRRIEIYVGPGRTQGQHVLIGTRETGSEQTRVLAPPILATLVLEDSVPSDPAYAVVFQNLQNLIESIEAIVVTHDDLQKQVYQSGEEEFPLVSTFQPYGPGAFQFEEKVKPTRVQKLPENGGVK